ncbi:hypothetical protein BCU84_19780 [Shewanella sp. 10N.286.51.B7]|nr:hypothetical protein BCU84_19780 [Shewanella sp. 10N.286.51.B7]
MPLAAKCYQSSVMPKTVDVSLGGYGWKVMSFAEGIDRNILNKIYNCLTAYLTWHSKVFVIRFDISLYDSPSNNKTIEKVIRCITSKQKKHYKSKVAYGWVREINSTDIKCHYHGFILLDGQKVRHSKTTFDIAMHARSLVIDTNIHFPKNCGYMIQPKDLTSIQAALYRLSYLAKNATKHSKPLGTKGFQFSRIKTKPISELTE